MHFSSLNVLSSIGLKYIFLWITCALAFKRDFLVINYVKQIFNYVQPWLVLGCLIHYFVSFHHYVYTDICVYIYKIMVEMYLASLVNDQPVGNPKRKV
jgi:hypothetical protein